MSLKETINQFINIQHSILMLGPQGMVLDTGNKRIAKEKGYNKKDAYDADRIL